MAEKSHELGGQRTRGVHHGELVAGGALAYLVTSFLPVSNNEEVYNASLAVFSPFQIKMMTIVLTGAVSFARKELHARKILKGQIVAASMVAILMLSGCGLSIGRVTPEIRTGSDGETIAVCKMEGLQLGIFDGGVCRNAEGGQIGNTFVSLFTGIVQAAVTGLAGAFTGVGAVGGVLQAVDMGPPVAPRDPAPELAGYETEGRTEGDGPSVPSMIGAPPGWGE